MSKFKPGDHIETINKGRGFEEAIVLGTFTETSKGKFKGKEMYLLKIPCGTATIPIEVEGCYKLVNKKTVIKI